MIVLLLVFAIVAAVVWAVAIAADALVGRRFRIPERLSVRIPGHLPLYVRQDRARARHAAARALTRTRTSTPED